jgi:hypothetical protein
MALESTELTSDLLHTLFEYRDGKLLWRSRTGKEAGCVGNRGYSCVCINYRKYMTHRLIWIMHGNDPVPMLDHINGDQLDNRIENLRPADASQNQRTQQLRKDSTSGIKGVSWISTRNRWCGQVWHKGKLHRAGDFHDKEECAAAVVRLRSSLHGEFARH